VRCRGKLADRTSRRAGPCAGNSVWMVRGERNGVASDQEAAVRLLEGGDGAIGLGELGLKVSENLGLSRSRARRWWQLRGWTAVQQGGANRTLIVLKSSPDAPEGPVAPGQVGLADRVSQAPLDDPLEEGPEGGCGEAESADFLGEPDTDGSSASVPAMAVAAEDSAGADGWPGAAVIESGENAMADEGADGKAVRAGGELESLNDGGPFRLVVVKPSFAAHDRSHAGGRLGA
jgi:hypothetical protein